MQAILETYSSMLLQALGQTMLLTLLSLLFAFIIGLIFGMMSVSKNRVLNIISVVYVDGLPILYILEYQRSFR